VSEELFALEDGEHSAVVAGGAANLTAGISRYVRGAITEKLFEVAALSRGWDVASNIGGGKDFDHIIRRPGIRPIVVQAKLATWQQAGNTYKIHNGTPRGPYSMDAYDVLAVYLQDLKKWVFYTRSELGNRASTTFTPFERRKRLLKNTAPNAREPDNWELLDQVADMYSQESLGVAQQMSDPPCTFDQ
jgi:hypothetical protein